MLKSKPLLWTCLTAWVLGSIYWHICQIKQLCEIFDETGILSERLHFADLFYGKTISLGTFYLSPGLLVQYTIILAVTCSLSFFIARSYETRKTRELRYRLNQITRELAFSKSKQ
ncbi:hypothetical protein [Dyadobacter aurulentus]|uniref:hypothetical protein n=1 Tax=Dyadobacter sp. UC 10 TaxID=2605428 RepID=UPI0011F3176E|nr:hypothetical protein [Dyadobacter sp. UC 10]KAA0989296.1 hypothetical protein FXO21_03530 [Dyadobacter sp. UC 10]